MLDFSLKDAVDIALVAALLYQSYRFFSHTRAVPLLVGLGLFLAFSAIVRFWGFETLSLLVSNISNYLVIGALIVLQPELRRIFASIGQARWYRALFPAGRVPVDALYSAITTLAEQRTGSLIVIVQKVGLRTLTEGGVTLSAILSRELLLSVFYDDNPLHDGAVIIEGDRLQSAATFLPMSNSPRLKRTHGARHRAGLGISEESDALVIVTSENRGVISACYMGEMIEKLEPLQLKYLLSAFNENRLEEEWNLLRKLSRVPAYSGGPE